MTALDLDDFSAVGAQRFRRALQPCMSDLLTVLAPLGASAAGMRLHQVEGLREFLVGSGCIGAIAKAALGEQAQPVRAILFNKSPFRTGLSAGIKTEPSV